MTNAERKEREMAAKRRAYDRMLKRDAEYDKLGFGAGKLPHRESGGLTGCTRGTMPFPRLYAM